VVSENLLQAIRTAELNTEEMYDPSKLTFQAGNFNKTCAVKVATRRR